ncbi:MAG: DUF362 domain-containing protein [Candidatus Omnitrophica bacterium]|nr:DUF362 domain-containing protein [Candidatus Omnitrophota bacterium]
MSIVGMAACVTYGQSEVYAAVRQVVEQLGGIAAFVQPGQRVLLKPNLLKAAVPEEAATTHPEFVRAVIRLVKTRTPHIFVGDSPAGLVKTETVYEQCGMRAVCREEGVNLVVFDRIQEKHGIPFARIAAEVDVCISLPKLKTHGLAVITAGVKNVFGLIAGLYKVQCHKDAPNARAFAAKLAHIYGLVRPQLSLCDAIIAMEGAGPAGGNPCRVGCVAGSADAVALDAVLAAIIGLPPFSVPSTAEAFRQKLGEARLERIEIRGPGIAALAQRRFRLARPQLFFRLPNALGKLATRLIPLVMAVDRRLCNGCGMCVRICPRQTIRLSGGVPVIEPRECILCLCCSEGCPQNAIDVQIRRFFQGKRRLR